MEIKAYNDLIKVIIICKKGFHWGLHLMQPVVLAYFYETCNLLRKL